MKKFIVASASPRRREILLSSGYSFEVVPSDADETIDENLSPAETVLELSKRKAVCVSKSNPGAVVFGCDTVVALGDTVLGKPENKADAVRMLKMLSGKTHEVLMGVCVTDSEKTECFFERTEVTFYPLSDDTIESYVQSGECDDKAGAYGIQGLGCVLVKEIKGDYFSVVGLPIAKTARVLSRFGIEGKVKL